MDAAPEAPVAAANAGAPPRQAALSRRERRVALDEPEASELHTDVLVEAY